VVILACLGMFAGGVVGAPSEAIAATGGTSFAPDASGTFTITGHGNGHGHGLSQYGARGAAMAGLSTAQILSFYYPGTTRTTLSKVPTIRVSITGGYTQTCVQAKAGLTATGVTGALPSAGSLKIWLTQTSMTLGAYASARCSGTPTKTWDQPGAVNIDISSADGYVHLLRADGTSADYYGSIGAAPSSAGEVTINRVSLDLYAQGVQPREMPASWNLSAVQAQTVAARTYAYFELQHASSTARYDICDNTNCQVYGGKARYDSAGNTLYTDNPAGAVNNKGQVLTYAGQAIFAQYSASNGGWTVDGGQPYLVSKQDPYDNKASGDPYLTWSRTATAAQVASYYGLGTVTAIEITGRDGNGDFGGRVTGGFVDGVGKTGTAAHIQATGYGLQAALGLPENWFSLGAASTPTPTPTLSSTDFYASYLTAMYKSFSPVPATAAQLRSWGTQLTNGVTPTALVTLIATNNTVRRFTARQLYREVLGTNPNSQQIGIGAEIIRKQGYLAYEVGLFSSKAFAHRAGATPMQLVTALFRNPLMLGKRPSAKTLNLWATRMKLQSHDRVISAMLKTPGVVREQVQAVGTAALGRLLTHDELTSWSAGLVGANYSVPLMLAAKLSSATVLQTYGVTVSETAG
jgi:peptidoglycan hydrolase-like amidase